MSRDASGPPLSATVDGRILVHGVDLASELIGTTSFTEMLLFELDGAIPSAARARVVDGVLVAIMEHGITPSSLAARLVQDGAPESLQGAVSAGLLATGSQFLGVIEEAASLLQGIVAAAGDGDDLRTAADAAAADLRAAGRRIPGFGHNLHGDADPRVPVLLDLIEREGLAGRHVEALAALTEAVHVQLDRRLAVNAAAAIGAVLSDLGYAPDAIRGFALVARCAGLFAHVVDERRRPFARDVWERAHVEFGQPRAAG
jgi:citrate synthase